MIIKEDASRFRCMCGQWCVDITEIREEMRKKDNITMPKE